MIQRKQSVFMLIAVVAVSLTFFFPYAQVGDIYLRHNGAFLADGSKADISHLYFQLSFLAAGMLTLRSIFLFKNRRSQATWLRMTFIFLALGLGLMSWFLLSATEIGHGSIQPGVSLFMPIAAFLCNVLALRAILKDEELVQSVSRIR